MRSQVGETIRSVIVFRDTSPPKAKVTARMRQTGERKIHSHFKMKLSSFLIIAALVASGVGNSTAYGFSIDAEFPGGNIVVDKIDGTRVFLHQDLCDTEGDWFYWHFRVRDAEGQTLTFEFTQSNVIGVMGPAISRDKGLTWSWLGSASVHEQSFPYTFGETDRDIRFCFAIPYLEADLQRFLQRHSGNSHLRVTTLCQSRKGRAVEKLHLGRIDGPCDYRVLLTCRHHACEMIASYVLEGIMESVLTGDDEDAWLRENVEFVAIPFMDKDGVEEGDQGKNRKPRDHNRDYLGESLYPSVKALRTFVPRWSQGTLRIAVDLHDPYIRGTHNEWIYFVGGPNQDIWNHVQQFSSILASVQSGPLLYDPKNNLPFGQAWNNGENYDKGKSCARWASELPGIRVATSLEIPYAQSSGTPVSAENAKAFGVDLAKAIARYLQAK
ncbi:MAG: M14 family zinc carboxypeptidase [bacterium]